MPAAELARLSSNLDAMATLMEAVRSDVKGGQSRTMEAIGQLKVLQSTLTDIKDDVEALTRIVRDGNGQPSLLHRMTAMETHYASVIHRLMTVESHLLAVETRYDTVVTSRMLTRGQIVVGVLGIGITALLSLGAILAQLFKH